MLLLSHIAIALMSILHASYVYFRPSPTGFKISYGLVSATIGSGTALVVVSHSPILSSCLTGLAYLGIVGVAIIAARYKFAHQKADN